MGKFLRPESMSANDCVIKFEQIYQKPRLYEIENLACVPAYGLLNSATSLLNKNSSCNSKQNGILSYERSIVKGIYYHKY